MNVKQVNIAVPLNLYKKMQKIIDIDGYRNSQDLFLDLVRKKVDSFEPELRKEYVKEILSIKDGDFLSIEETEKFHNLLEKRRKNEKKNISKEISKETS